MILLISRSGLIMSRAHMGIWNRWKRGGLRYSLGIETKGGRFTRLIRKRTPLPISVTEIFTTAEPKFKAAACG